VRCEGLVLIPLRKRHMNVNDPDLHPILVEIGRKWNILDRYGRK